MPASTYASINGSVFELPSDGQHPTKLSSSQPSPEIIVAIIFGVCTIGIGLATIWQSHKTWRTSHLDGARNASVQQADVELGNSQASVTAPERGPIVSSASWTPSTHTMETSSEQKDHHVLPKGQTVSRLSDESLGSQQTLNDERTSIAQPAPINTDVTLSSTMLYSPSGARPVIDEHDGQDLSHDPKLPDMEK